MLSCCVLIKTGLLKTVLPDWAQRYVLLLPLQTPSPLKEAAVKILVLTKSSLCHSAALGYFDKIIKKFNSSFFSLAVPPICTAFSELGFCRAWSPLTLHGGLASLQLLLLHWAAFGTCTDFATPRELHWCQSPPSRQPLKPDCSIPALIKSTRHGNDFSSPSFFPLISLRKEDLIFFFFPDPPKRNHSNHSCNYIYIYLKNIKIKILAILLHSFLSFFATCRTINDIKMKHKGICLHYIWNEIG